MSQAAKHVTREPSSIDNLLGYIYEYRHLIKELKRLHPEVFDDFVERGTIRRLANE